MHLNGIGLPQIIVSSKYNVSSWKIFSRWSVQLLDESPLFGTDDVFIGLVLPHVSYTIIDWLMHNNARYEITTICFIFKRYLLFCRLLSFILPFFVIF